MFRCFIVFFALCVASAAHADDRVRVETASALGFTMGAPAAEAEGGQLVLSGSVCRRAFTAGAPRFVRVDRYAEDGALLSSHHAPIRGMPGYRGGCGFYVVSAPALGPDETVRVSAVRR